MYHIDSQFSHLVDIVRALRGDNGCPWDKRQTSESLVKYLKSEFDELLSAIENADPDNLCEELGDVLFLLVMIAEINDTEKNFSLSHVLSGIAEKLIRRHPHVFAGKQVTDEQELRKQWEEIKAMEKAKKLI